ncbi:hypothetical protein AAD018_002030 [Aestuariibius insulae]|uniref:hypothetical protein n=1 Tax=Aestuariibius insulae TaxID=2058287 RepID=UPI00345E0E0D
MRIAVVLVLMVLSGCATKQQRCVQEQARDLLVINQLIASTQANLDRGYAIETERVPVRRYGFCSERLSDGRIIRLPCSDIDYYTRRKAVAIDLEAEQSKLNQLLDRQPIALERARAGQAACIAQYPES